MSEKLDQIVKSLDSLTLLESSEIVKALEEKWGVSAAAVPVSAATSSASTAADSGDDEEKSEFDVVLVKGDDGKKMQTIKALRAAVSGLGLKEAKEMAEGSNVTIKSGVSKKDAEDLKKALEELGAEVKLA
jgi:large subunit ribosomal protein L7/L12